MEWSHVLGMADRAARDQQLENMVRRLPAMDDGELKAETSRLIEAEYSLDDEALRDATISRLRAILKLDDDDALRVEGTYDSVMNGMSANVAFRRAAVVQTVARHEFSVDEESRLRALVPNVLGVRPQAPASTASASGPEAAQTHMKRPWWMFWRRQKAAGQQKAPELSVPSFDERGYSDNVTDELRRMRNF